MKPSLHIADSDRFSLAAVNTLSSRFHIVHGAETMRDAITHCHAVWIRLERITADDIPDNPQCKFIACPATGIDHIDLEACQRAGIEVISLQGEREFLNGVRATAEHTIALMLSLLRRVPWASSSVLKGQWTRDSYCGSELHGKTVGIIGHGRVGKQVASILKAFGCTVLSCDKGGDVDMLLKQADIISLHIPLNESTHHWLDAAKVARIKTGAVLINTSRGAVIDESAVATAVLSGQLAGVAVDVLEGEPDIAESPLAGLARSGFPVLITPHIGGKTRESCEKTEVFLANKLVQAMRNAPPDEDGYDSPGEIPDDIMVSPLTET